MATLDDLDVKVDDINRRLDRMNGMLEERCKAQREHADTQIKQLREMQQVGATAIQRLDNRFWGLLAAIAIVFAGEIIGMVIRLV